MNLHRTLKLAISLSFFLFFVNLEAGDTSGSSNYRERFRQASDPERTEPIEEGKGEGDGGGGSKGGKSRKKKKKKDDVKRVVGPRDPIVPVTGVKTGDLTAVTYKSPTPTAPLLEKAWNSTAWAPTYQAGSRSFFGGKGLQSVVQSDLIEHTGWQVDGDSISTPPNLSGGPYDVQTGQAIGSSGGVFGVIGRAASALTWDNPISFFGPNNPFLLVRKNPLKNPFGIVQSVKRLANNAGVLSAWAFEEGGVQITDDGGIGIIHDPSGGQALLAGAGIALWFTPIKIGPALSAGARIIPGAARTLAVAAALSRGAWGRVSGFGQRAWGHVAGLGQRAWGHVGQTWQSTNDFLRTWVFGSHSGTAFSGPYAPVQVLWSAATNVWKDKGFQEQLSVLAFRLATKFFPHLSRESARTVTMRAVEEAMEIAAKPSEGPQAALNLIPLLVRKARSQGGLRGNAADDALPIAFIPARPQTPPAIFKHEAPGDIRQVAQDIAAGSSTEAQRVITRFMDELTKSPDKDAVFLVANRFMREPDQARALGLSQEAVTGHLRTFLHELKNHFRGFIIRDVF